MPGAPWLTLLLMFGLAVTSLPGAVVQTTPSLPQGPVNPAATSSLPDAPPPGRRAAALEKIRLPEYYGVADRFPGRAPLPTGPRPTTNPAVVTTPTTVTQANASCAARLNDEPAEYSTVQAAIDASTRPTDVVKVAGYCTDVNSYGGLAQVAYVDRSLTLRGGYTITNWLVSDPEANPTTLDAQGEGRVIYIDESPIVTIEGLRVTGGDPTGLGGYYGMDSGGGIYALGDRLKVQNCTISQNRVGLNGEGAGLFLQTSTAVIERNQIANNYGDGLFANGGTVKLRENQVSENTSGLELHADAELISNTISANLDGGIVAYSTIALTGNVVVFNSAYLADCSGLAVHGGGGSLTAYDNLFAFNSQGYWDGALCSWESSVTLIGNTFAQNQGGGAHIAQGSATILNNEFLSNTVGSGLYVANLDNFTCSGNRIVGNSTLYYGGGIYIQTNKGQLVNNTILSNTSEYAGGGVYAYGNDLLISGNEIVGNLAETEGGGIIVDGSGPTVANNTISANTAASGGGLYFLADGVLRGNTFSYNTARDGGGAYLNLSRALLENNLVFGNSASYNGGGLFLRDSSMLVNNALFDNDAGRKGSGIYISDTSPRLEFTTLHDNHGGDGSGIYIASGRPLLVNTIVAGQGVGILAASGIQVTIDGVLWYGNGANTGGPGTFIISNAWTGDPLFGPDGYHIQAGSAAVDRGVAALFPLDIDDESRLQSLPPDLGVDEIGASTPPCRARLNGGGPIYSRVQAAIDASTAPGDIVEVSGLCRDEVPWFGELRVVVLAKTLTLRGGYSPDFSVWDPLRYPTVLDGENEHGVVAVSGIVSPTVEYLTLVRGYAEIGGGLENLAGGAIIRHLNASYNIASSGAGVSLDGSGGLLKTCSIAENWGAGLYVTGGQAVISDTEIVDNVGEGVRLTNSSAILVANRIVGNAYAGVGVQGGHAVLGENEIAGNRGSGVYLESGYTTLEQNAITGNSGYQGAGIYAAGQPTILENTVTENSATEGGGVYLAGTPALFQGNTISGNHAQYGGGVYTRVPSTLSGNTISGNYTTQDGGGVYVYRTTITLNGNTIRENQASRNGGGLLQNQGTVNAAANLFWNNTAQRGGAFYLSTGQASLVDTIIADNQSTIAGSGLYVVNMAPTLLHATIAHNSGGDGTGLYYDAAGKTMGLTNTILVSQTVGVFVQAGTVDLDGTLWNGNGQNWSGAVTHLHDYTGSPAFADAANGDYHIRFPSAARDRGINTGLATDFDGEPRLIGPAPDLGADEVLVDMALAKSATPNPVADGGTLTYTLRLTNTGLLTYTAVVTDVLPAHVSPGGTLTWTVALAPGEEWEQAVGVTVAAGYSGTLTNQARAETGEQVLVTATRVVTVEERVAGLMASNDSPTALGDTTHLAATVAHGSDLAYSWAFGDGSYGSGAAPGHIYPAAGVYTAVVTASNHVSLLTATTVVTVEEAVAGLTAVNDGPTALGDTTQMTATATAGSDLVYSWAFGDGGYGGGATPLHLYPAVGSYTAVVTAGNSVSLLTATTVVTVEETVAGLTAVNDGPTVLGYPTALTATVSSGSDVTYDWVFGDGTLGSGATLTHTYPAPGTYTALVTAGNAVSVMTATTTVIVDETIEGLSAWNDSPTVLGGPTQLTATAPAGSRIVYSWAFGDGTGGSGATPTHTYPAPGAYTALVTASNSVSVMTATTGVSVDEAIAGLAAWNDGPTALGSSTQFTATVSGGSRVAFSWAFGDGTTGSGANPGHLYPAVGIYTAVVTADNSVSTLTATTVVTVQETIGGLSARNDSPTALGRPTHLTATLAAGSPVSYTWSLGDGAYGSGAALGHTYPATGTYTALVTASNGVSAMTATTVVTVDEMISGLAAENDGPTALGRPTALTATLSSGSRVTYAWAFGDGTSGSGAAPVHTYSATGSYTAVVTARNSVSVMTATTVVVVDEPIAQLAAWNDSPTVLGSWTHLTATLSGGSRVLYSWALGDGSGGSGATISYTYPAPGAYTAVVTASNSVSVLTATTTVTVDEAVAGLAAWNDGPTALGSPTTLTATVSAGSRVLYGWAFGDGTAGSGAALAHTYPAPGSYTAVVTASNSVGVLMATTLVVVDEPIIGLSATNDGPTALADPTTLTATVVAGSHVSYSWALGDGITGAGAVLEHTYPATGTYTAVVTASNSVSLLTATTVVTVEEGIGGLHAWNDSPTALGQWTHLTATVTAGSGTIYQWSFGDGTLGSGPTVGHLYPAVGTYTAVVTAANSLGVLTTTTEVLVEETIAGLTAWNDSPTVLGLPTTLTATITLGSGVTYSWDFGDGVQGEGAVVQHVYSDTGAYTATATAVNAVGRMRAETVVRVAPTTPDRYFIYLPLVGKGW